MRDAPTGLGEPPKQRVTSANGTVSWSYPGASPFASIRYAATLSPDGVGYIRLRYMARGESMDYRVRLVTTRPNYGGLRWWFLCPVSAERGIEKRAAKLYLPLAPRSSGAGRPTTSPTNRAVRAGNSAACLPDSRPQLEGTAPTGAHRPRCRPGRALAWSRSSSTRRHFMRLLASG